MSKMPRRNLIENDLKYDDFGEIDHFQSANGQKRPRILPKLTIHDSLTTVKNLLWENVFAKWSLFSSKKQNFWGFKYR